MEMQRPDPKRREAKADVMQAALQVEAYLKSPADPHLLLLADDADPPCSVVDDADPSAGAVDEHDYDDVVQQSFPASDPPPLP